MPLSDSPTVRMETLADFPPLGARACGDYDVLVGVSTDWINKREFAPVFPRMPRHGIGAWLKQNFTVRAAMEWQGLIKMGVVSVPWSCARGRVGIFTYS